MSAPARTAPDERFRELVLLIATLSERDPRFSSTKLNKILFFCDFGAFRAFGAAITGEAYQKLQFGPAPRRLLPVLSRMKEVGDCIEIERDHFGRQQKRIVACRPPKVRVFSQEELYFVERVVQDLWHVNASEVSDLSHEFEGWKAASLGEDIPYETAFVGNPSVPVSSEEIEYCRGLAG